MNNPTVNVQYSPSFPASRDRWLLACNNSKTAQKRIKSKISTIVARQKRLATIQNTINSDIAKLKTEILQLEQFIEDQHNSMVVSEYDLELALKGELS